jgi:hypothetical protein
MLIAALALLLSALWFVPRSRLLFTTVDNTSRWSEFNAPPRREVVWQSATLVPVADEQQSPAANLITASVNDVSLIRPQPADNGQTLYLTVRRQDQDLDIMQSHRGPDGWSIPQAVDVLNSRADDVGPVLSADGDTLYLYSNRAGGFGGMDLYVSKREKDQWTEPVNLGSAINSPAHEYDPAISPDGGQLFFASNRSERRMRQSQADAATAHLSKWTTTLRNNPGKLTFDLYVANWNWSVKQWASPEPLSTLNTSEFNEGAPVVSPDGAFLFFASDRPFREGESPNLDLYRVRLEDLGSPPENLGTGINTAVDETEPCLSSGGFELMFSRADAAAPERFALHQSIAMEVYRDRQWDASHWQSLVGFSGRVIEFLGKYLWLILMAWALVAAMLWLIRQVRMGRLAIPGFLVAALLLHFLLVTSSFFVYFQQTLAQKFKALFVEEQIIATEFFQETTSQTTSDQPSFDSVAELEMPDPIEPTEMAKQSLAAPTTTPIELAQPVQIAAQPMHVNDLPADPVIATVAVADPTPQPPVKELLSRAAVERVIMPESVQMQTTQAVPMPKLETVAIANPLVQRQPASEVNQQVETLSVETLKPTRTQLLAEAMQPAQQTPVAVQSTPLEVELNRATVNSPEQNAVDAETVSLDQNIAAQQSAPLANLATEIVELERSPLVLPAAVPQEQPQQLTQQNDRAPMLATAQAIAKLATSDTSTVPDSAPTQTPLLRSRVNQHHTDAETPIATQKIEMVQAAQGESLSDPTSSVDAVKQSAQETPVFIATLAVPSDTVPSRVSPVVEPSTTLARLTGQRGAPSPHDPLGGSTLARRTHRAAREYADVQANMQSLLMRRKLDEATKAAVVKQFGGNDETLAAIRRGLNWIEQHQTLDGHWGLHNFHEQCQGHDRCSGHGNSRSDTAGTGLALLPMLGDGNTHLQGTYQENVARGITWLVKNQKPDGDLFTGGEGNSRMYSHAIATIALCECYGMTGDTSLKVPSQKAIDFIVAAQDPRSGGWRYQPRRDADTSVVGWQVMALKSGQMAELNVPEKTLKDSQRWLASVAGEKDRLGQFAYQHGRFNPAMTAEAILCLEYLGEERDSESINRGTLHLLDNLPQAGRETSYYWYYATQALFHLQGDAWQRWNGAIHPLLLQTQTKEGPIAGTWDPKDQWEHSGGRIYATSLRVLMLEVYYRHLPIYQVLD